MFRYLTFAVSVEGSDAAGPKFSFVRYPSAMADTDADKLLNNAEECLRQAERAISDRDKEEWIRLASEWIELARAAKSRQRKK